MPEIKLKHVVSCSTEDSTHKADNLLSSDTYRKWKSARPGEKQTTATQHGTTTRHHSITIQHNTATHHTTQHCNTARQHTTAPQHNNTTQQHSTATQHIPRKDSANIAYGVSFIKFHSPPDGSEPPAATPPKLTKLGQFRVKDESPASGSNLQPGSLFFNRDAPAKPSPALKGTLTILSPYSHHTHSLFFNRDAPAKPSPALKGTLTILSPYSLSHHTPTILSAPVKRKFEFSKERQEAPPPPAKKPSPSVSPQTGSATPRTKPSSAHMPSPNPAKKKKPEIKPKPKPRSVEAVPLNRIMEGVVFVLSGFQNPFRGELRDKALAMGGRYRPDWTPDSTHLICAFANTPKYGQVKAAGGLIVRKEWVLDCHKRKQKISYKRYLMDGAESSSEESGPEEEDGSDEEVEKKSPEKRSVTPRKSPVKSAVKEEEEYGGSTDGPEEDGSGMDTEDELRRFYLYGTFPDNQRRLLQRYIIAFDGAMEEYMSEKVQFVITSQGWDDSFEDALMENGNLSFVKPTWIFAINDRQKLLPYQPYTVVP
uniref:X-ray repair complementing defective repair in Chinese hamster cells 1 n=1 Tax=Astyanax mexicanus TaxID=7994 RepID=A0A8B9HJG6_ASTMX